MAMMFRRANRAERRDWGMHPANDRAASDARTTEEIRTQPLAEVTSQGFVQVESDHRATAAAVAPAKEVPGRLVREIPVELDRVDPHLVALTQLDERAGNRLIRRVDDPARQRLGLKRGSRADGKESDDEKRRESAHHVLRKGLALRRGKRLARRARAQNADILKVRQRLCGFGWDERPKSRGAPADDPVRCNDDLARAPHYPDKSAAGAHDPRDQG